MGQDILTWGSGVWAGGNFSNAVYCPFTFGKRGIMPLQIQTIYKVHKFLLGLSYM